MVDLGGKQDKFRGTKLSLRKREFRYWLVTLFDHGSHVEGGGCGGFQSFNPPQSRRQTPHS